MSKKRYYLAYGSNLNRKQMEARCPGAKPIGTALLEGYELLFKGSKTGFYLTIEPRADGVVPIAVWEVTAGMSANSTAMRGAPSATIRRRSGCLCSAPQAEGRSRPMDFCTS